MRIMGVDPGSLVTGFGVVDAGPRGLARVSSGAIVLRSADPLHDRLAVIYDALLREIDLWHPDSFCIETAFYSKNVQSTLKLGHVRGVAMLAAVHRALPIAEYSPREVKRAVTGTGAASKLQVAYMVKHLLGLTTSFARSDEADGLALAICHAGVAPRAVRGPSRSSSWAAFVKDNPERVRA